MELIEVVVLLLHFKKLTNSLTLFVNVLPGRYRRLLEVLTKN